MILWEGIYYYDIGNNDIKFLNKVKYEKGRLRICSLSSRGDDIVMWSHYADFYRGVAIEVEINNGDDKDYTARKIEYVSRSYFSKLSGDAKEKALEILSHKTKEWSYEKETRIFTSKYFVKVNVKKIIFGNKVNSRDKGMIKKLMKQKGLNIECKDFEFEKRKLSEEEKLEDKLLTLFDKMELPKKQKLISSIKANYIL